MIFKRIQGGYEPFDNEAHKTAISTPVGGTTAFDKVINPRNVKFHRKYFALLNFAFQHWNPGELNYKKTPSVVPEKSFDQFREDVTILAGFYRQEIRLDGSVRTKAKSVSFGNMKPEAFEELYSNTINVILKRVLVNYDKEQLDKVIMELLNFD